MFRKREKGLFFKEISVWQDREANRRQRDAGSEAGRKGI